MTSEGNPAADRLERARLYFVTDAATPDAFLHAALDGGVDMLQLRDRSLSPDDLRRAAERFRAVCDAHDALFWVNDDPDLAVAAGADGVHVGQNDMPVAEARRDGLLVGLSTHSPAEMSAALIGGADELSAGPVWPTPTKPGRPAAGLDYVRHAAQAAGERPWFAIGGIDEENVNEVVEAGASRVAVVRAIRDAADPGAAATNLRAALDRRPVGAAG